MVKRNKPQLRSQSYVPATEDQAFLNRDDMRATRLALEFAKPDIGLRESGIASTVVVFGSARIPSPDMARTERDKARTEADSEHAARRVRLSHWYAEARHFARIVSERGGALHSPDGLCHNVIATGGGPGIMEASNRGAADAGAPSVGFNIVLPEEQEPNSYSSPELTFQFRYFAMRKMHLAMRANGLAFFPGGFGTMDELFEILTLDQTGKAPRLPVVLFGRDYWSRVVDFEMMVEWGMIATDDVGLFEIVETAEEGWDALLQGGLRTGAPPADI